MLDTIGVLYDGYDYFRKKFSESQKDLIEARFFFQKVVVIKGEEGAKIFYDHTKFKRNGATPKRFQKTLFGEGGVQGLDGQAHSKRKKLFMQVMNVRALKKIEKKFKKKAADCHSRLGSERRNGTFLRNGTYFNANRL
ncbi:hypothetical protein [Christiangramia sp.]|uniref:hypothetical protein n=1 Tax=Christiangramia sp. TaxID=1931228 RepID=UPI00262B6818|nr:hypothetical protein [Christiangramia sp.]